MLLEAAKQQQHFGLCVWLVPELNSKPWTRVYFVGPIAKPAHSASHWANKTQPTVFWVPCSVALGILLNPKLGYSCLASTPYYCKACSRASHFNHSTTPQNMLAEAAKGWFGNTTKLAKTCFCMLQKLDLVGFIQATLGADSQERLWSSFVKHNRARQLQPRLCSRSCTCVCGILHKHESELHLAMSSEPRVRDQPAWSEHDSSQWQSHGAPAWAWWRLIMMKTLMEGFPMRDYLLIGLQSQRGVHLLQRLLAPEQSRQSVKHFLIERLYLVEVLPRWTSQISVCWPAPSSDWTPAKSDS